MSTAQSTAREAALSRHIRRFGIGWLLDNPVVSKEVRTRMRGGRAFVLVTVHLAALALILGLAYAVFSASLTTSSTLEDRRTFGKLLFGLLVGVELVAISFTAPALTSGAIAAEHERQTYDLLKVSLLPARALVLGKYLAGLIFILLLVSTSLPLLGPAFIIGGILPQEVIISILVLLVTAVAFCAVGMFFSSLVKRTLFATVLSYAYAILTVFGVPIIVIFLLSIAGVMMNQQFNNLTTIQEIMLVFTGWLIVSTNPGATLIATEIAILDGQGIWSANVPISNGIEVWVISPWIAYIWLYSLLSLILIFISIQRVNRIER